MRKILSLFVLMSFLIIGPWAYAQTQAPVAQTEAEFRLLKEQYQLLQEKEEKLVSEYGKIIETLREERKEHQDFVQRIYTWISIAVVVIIGIFGSMLAFFGWNRYKQIKADIDNLVNKECAKLIDDVVSGERNIIENQLKKYNLQAKIRRKNRIIILSMLPDGGNKISKYLTDVGFAVTEDEIASFFYYEGSVRNTVSDWDVVILNELTNEWDNDTIQSRIVDSLKDKAILFYQCGTVYDKNKKINVSAVNMPSQLYGNLMNLLEYREAVN